MVGIKTSLISYIKMVVKFGGEYGVENFKNLEKRAKANFNPIEISIEKSIDMSSALIYNSNIEEEHVGER